MKLKLFLLMFTIVVNMSDKLYILVKYNFEVIKSTNYIFVALILQITNKLANKLKEEIVSN
jgi:hypothetical protein